MRWMASKFFSASTLRQAAAFGDQSDIFGDRGARGCKFVLIKRHAGKKNCGGGERGARQKARASSK
jgi:hypothetical protein